MPINLLNRDALVVGICQYDDLLMSPQLDTLAEQAEQLAQLLEQQGGFKVKRLPSTAEKTLDLKVRVTLPELEQAIEQLFYPPKESPTQIALLFFAGHGLVKSSRLGTEGFLATSEADGKSIHGLSLKTLRKLLRNSPVKQQIVFLEACHSGEFFNDFQTDKEHDYCLITSARAHETALAEGLLTQALLDLLNCSKYSEGYITSNLLIRGLQEKESVTPGWQRFQWRNHGRKIVLCNATTLKGKLRRVVASFLQFSWQIIYWFSIILFTGFFFFLLFFSIYQYDKTEKPIFPKQAETKPIEKKLVQEKQENSPVSIPELIDSVPEKPKDIQVFAQQGLTNVWRMRFSSDGKMMLASDNAGKVKLWNVASGREIRAMTNHSDRAIDLGFLSNQTALIADWNRNVWQWNLVSGTEIKIIKAGYGGNCGVWHTGRFSADGKRFLGVCSRNNLEFWDMELRSILYTLTGHSKAIRQVSFSLDGKFAVSGSEDDTIKVWDLNTGREIYTLSGYAGNVNAVTFSPNGKTLLSGGDDKVLKLWDISTGGLIRTFTGHSDTIWSVDISPDGKTAVSGSFDHTVKIWNINTGQEIHTLKEHKAWLRVVKFSPDGRIILSGDEKGVIKLWDARLGQLIGTTSSSAGMQSIAVAYNGQLVLAGSEDGSLHFWNLISGEKIRTLTGHFDSVDAVALAPDGHTALSGSRDRTAKLWNVDTGYEIHTLRGHSNSIATVAFSINGQMALTGSSDETIKLWDVDSGQEIRTLRGHSSAVLSASFSPDGHTILSGSRDGSIRLWNATTGQEIYTLDAKAGNVFDTHFSPDGQTALSSHFSSVIKLWDMTSGKEISTLRGHLGRIYAVSFSPDGRTALSGGEDGTFRLWDVSSGYEVSAWDFSGNISRAGITFIPKTHNALSVSYTEPTIHLWNTDTRKEVVQMITFNDGEWLTITPEGYYHASAAGEKYINVRTKNNQVTNIKGYKLIYHRPDIVQSALKLGNGQKPLLNLSRER
jgi:WD40 repeat protein